MQRRSNLYHGGNESFICDHCGQDVLPLQNGSARNHCPFCFYSKHLDRTPGDRGSDCGGLMEPIAVDSHPKKGYQVIHACLRCGMRRKNKLALDDPRQPDGVDTLLEMFRTAAHRRP